MSESYVALIINSEKFIEHFGLKGKEAIEFLVMQASQWQPISTAPKDGTWILGHYCGRNWSVKNSIEGKHNCVVIYWEDRTDLVESRWNSFGPSSYFEKDIDLWMPITQPPEGK